MEKASKKREEEKMYAPVAGTVFHHLFNFTKLHDFSTSRARQNPTYRILSPFHCEVYTVDPANVECILKTNFANCGKGDYNYCNLRDLLGDGIFAVDGEKWWHQRKIASLELSKRIFKDYSSKIFRSNALKLVSMIAQTARSNCKMDIQDFFMKSTMDSIFQVTFRIELNSLSGSNDEEREFTEAFDDANVLISWRYVDPLWKMKKFLNFGCEAVLKDKLKVVDDFVYKLLEHKVSESPRQDPKICFSDDTSPDGHDVKKGDMVAYMPYSMGRMRSIWGDDAEVFLPERWLKDSVGFVQESPFKFTAF